MDNSKSPSNSIKNDSKKPNILDNKNKEIELLKKEISDLKTQREEDKKNIDELKSFFQTEMKKLQNQIKSLSEEITTLKMNKKKQRNDNINNDNDNIINNDDIVNCIEEDDIKYSLECLSRKLNIDIIQGTDKANLDIGIKNSSKEKYPENACLICDKKISHLLCDDIELGELEPNQQKIITIWFKNLKCISKGTYKCYIKLMINNKVYNSSKIELTVNVVSSQNNQNTNMLQNNFGVQNNPHFQNNFNNINPFLQNINGNQNQNNNISAFRDQFNLYDIELYPDERIQNALMTNDNDFNKAFESLYN